MAMDQKEKLYTEPLITVPFEKNDLLATVLDAINSNLEITTLSISS